VLARTVKVFWMIIFGKQKAITVLTAGDASHPSGFQENKTASFAARSLRARLATDVSKNSRSHAQHVVFESSTITAAGVIFKIRIVWPANATVLANPIAGCATLITTKTARRFVLPTTIASITRIKESVQIVLEKRHSKILCNR
jgi:hypothetical protein